MSHMGAGRPPKQGLSYHGSDTDLYNDFKIMDLMNEYGPCGTTIYDVIIKMVFRTGYYLEIPMEKLTLSVIKTIGNKWIRNKGLVLQVVQYCADIGLFDKDLLQQSVITSVGIQKRYAMATVRSKVQIKKYRLLKEESEKPLFAVPQNSISDTEKGINVTEIQNNDAEIPIKERKEKNIYITEFQSPEVGRAFAFYLLVREQNHGAISSEQVQALRDDLMALSEDESEQIAIIKKAAAGGWKSFYKLGKPKETTKKEKPKPSQNKFHNFSGRDYGDMSDLTRRIIEGGGLDGQ